jgi:hypothetical protein
MPKPPSSTLELRAAKLSHVPGMTIDEASERFRIGAAAIKRARKDPASKPSLAELALAALTYNGTQREGALELAPIASWIDYVNHDGCTEADVRALLDSCELLAIEGTRWRLLGEWP